MSIEQEVVVLRERLATEQRAAEIREEVIRDLTTRLEDAKEEITKERLARISDFGQYQESREELATVKRDLEFVMAKINTAKQVLG